MIQDILKILREAFKGQGRRAYILAVVFICLFLWVIIRLFNLQIINGQYYVDNYVQKSVKYVTIPAARGNIYDKDGQILAYNELVKNITIADIDAYEKNNKGINDRNIMLLKLSRILRKYKADIDSKYFIKLDENKNMVFTTGTEKQHRQFIANIYGRLVSDLDEGQNYRFPSGIGAREAFEYSKKRYAMDVIYDENNRPIIIDDATLLDMIGIHFTMRLTSYQKYQPTVIAQNVSSRCAYEIQESKGELKGVDVEETSRRRYNYSTYFAHIIGYTGKTSEENIEELKKSYDQYDINDPVGLLGIEKSQEQVLRGTKGYRKIVVDSGGRILEVLEEKESKAGNDIYLTISVQDQIADYHLLEQQLAGLVASKVVNEEVDKSKEGSSSMRIQATDAYYQLIDNNVLDREHFTAYDAGQAEKEIYRLFVEYKKKARQEIYNNLMENNPPIQKNLTQEIQGYLAYIYTYLHTVD
ncbi:MAG: penicillin-binding protein, partial [Lachnospiraceae bacterium]|nr:penicillin-binding protein [Lachnospiraceae bacterium]